MLVNIFLKNKFTFAFKGKLFIKIHLYTISYIVYK